MPTKAVKGLHTCKANILQPVIWDQPVDCKQFDYWPKEWLESYSVSLHWLQSLFNTDDINDMNDKRKHAWNAAHEERRRPA
jgi:hypothetical protein